MCLSAADKAFMEILFLSGSQKQSKNRSMKSGESVSVFSLFKGGGTLSVYIPSRASLPGGVYLDIDMRLLLFSYRAVIYTFPSFPIAWPIPT